ncbi:MAG: transporter substrate-binding domain-containing protein [Pseudomonadota bacterium]
MAAQPSFRLFLASLFLIAGNALAEETTFSCPKKPIKIGYSDFGIFYNEKLKTGLDKDIVQKIIEKTNCRFEEKSYSRSSLWAQLKSGKVDISLSSVNTKERSKIAKFSYYGVAKTSVLFHTGARAATLVEFTKNTGQKMGSVSGTSYGPALDLEVKNLKKTGRVVEFATEEKLFQAFKKKKIDVLLFFIGVKERYLSPEENATYSQTEWIGEIEPHGLAFSNKSSQTALFPWFDRIIQDMVKSGEIKTLAAKYLTSEELPFYHP